MSLWRFILGVICACLLLATVVSWSRSYSAMDIATYSYGKLHAPGENPVDPQHWSYTARTIEVNHVLGNVRFMVSRYTSVGATRDDMHAMPTWIDHPRWAAMSVPRKLLHDTGSFWTFHAASWHDWNILGVGLQSVSQQGTATWTASAPHWLLSLVFATAAWRLIGVPWWRWKRGRCPKCAYDLRAVIDPRCPGCGWDRGDTVKPAAEPPATHRRAA